MIVFIEFIAGTVIGIYFHSVLKFEEAAYLVFGAALLLALLTSLIQEEIAASRKT